mgnify:CR=1 FL=1
MRSLRLKHGGIDILNRVRATVIKSPPEALRKSLGKPIEAMLHLAL